jgi:tRNA-uridine 2-sulfurtransferase
MATQQNEPKNNLKVAVGISGGVDSSVSAFLLKEQGYDVTGAYMQCWDEKADGCRAEEDRKDAVQVANHLGIKFVHLDFVKEYKERVISYFYDEYRAGRTPNPDIICNRDIKFGMFLRWAIDNGFDMIATGHYARVEKREEQYVLLKGVDTSKDQSYFLYLLGQEQLSRTLFPVGHLLKSRVREIAHQAGLPTFNKPDSMGICFIGEVDIKEFLKKELSLKPGKVVDKEGEVIGSHDGAHFYTVGQRHGFLVEKYTGLPMYVTGKDVEKNELTVGHAGDVVRNSFKVGTLHWVVSEPEDSHIKIYVRIRHLGELHPATVYINEGTAEVTLEDQVFGVAPGQSAVFYDGDTLLGGGIILG